MYNHNTNLIEEEKAMPTQPEKRILIVDDDTLALETLHEGLKPLGYPIDMAPDGAIALTHASNKLYSLIITDWFMKVMNGNVFVQKLRLSIRYKHTPVIFVTCNKDIEAVKQAKAIGISKYMVKPINVPTIRKCVETILGD